MPPPRRGRLLIMAAKTIVQELADAYSNMEVNVFVDATLDRFTWAGTEYKGQVDLIDRKEALMVGGFDNQTEFVIHARTAQFSGTRPTTGQAITYKGKRYQIASISGSEDDNEESYSLVAWP